MTTSINDPANIYRPAKVSYLTDESSDFRESLSERLEKAGSNIEDFFYLIEAHEGIKNIAVKFQLSETQTIFLTCIIRDVAVAITYYGDMPKVIQEKLDVPEAIARQIAQAVTELYDFALEDIKKLQVETFRERMKQNSPTQKEGNVVNLREKK